MKLVRHIVLLTVATVLLASCQTTLPKGVTPVMATWLYGEHALPSTATISGNEETFRSSAGDPLWTNSAEKMVKPGKKLRVAMYLHGCGGISGQAIQYRELMHSLGYAVFMPDSFQRPGREVLCGQGGLGNRISLRLREVDYALSKIRQLSWVDQDRIILMGFSEGGNTTDNFDEKGFAAHIVLGSACTQTRDSVPMAPKGTPVLAIVGERDRYRPGIKCYMERTVGGSKSISIPYAGHSIAHLDETKEAITTFLRKCCS